MENTSCLAPLADNGNKKTASEYVFYEMRQTLELANILRNSADEKLSTVQREPAPQCGKESVCDGRDLPQLLRDISNINEEITLVINQVQEQIDRVDL